MADTVAQFEHVIAVCRDLYAKKLQDYGPSWRIMRPQSITDQIFIKAKRIRSIEIKGETMVDEGIRSEFIGEEEILQHFPESNLFSHCFAYFINGRMIASFQFILPLPP